MTAPNHTRCAAALLTALLASLLTGCGRAGGEPGAGPGPTPVPLTAEDDDFALPVDAYGYTAEESGRLLLAREVLTVDCLRRHGATNLAEAERGTLEQLTRTRIRDLGMHGNKRRYGVTGMATARAYGYHLPSTVDDAQGQQAKTPAGQRQCVGEATRALAGTGPLGSTDLVRNISWESYNRSLHAPRLTEALGRWSACMKAKGYDRRTPMDAGARFDTSTPTTTPEEIAVATADVTCKAQTHLVETWYGVEAETQNSAIAAHAAELDTAKALHDQCMRRVAEVIATPP